MLAPTVETSVLTLPNPGVARGASEYQHTLKHSPSVYSGLPVRLSFSLSILTLCDFGHSFEYFRKLLFLFF